MQEVQDLAGMSLGLGTVVGLVSGSLGAAGVWFKLKSIVKVQAMEIINLNKSMDDLKEGYSEDKKVIHERLDHHRTAIDDNKDKSDSGLADMKQFINDMKVEIIREIHSNKRDQ